ncbi:S26A6-like protein [Mya arenaria]|uniref:S26A6-like protein n=1 Tax=Mya arenaria TaxID=6604 RepID=A0ABY7DIT9_MYAAR|nr:solute carrier family 26 member 6-like [Mya arenaria]WAQ96617.1 S26A6-like protein [Mya arenaria]
MSVSASRNARRKSITREIYRRQSRELHVLEPGHPELAHGGGKPHTERTRRHSGPKPHILKRFFASIPEADRKYLPVPKSFRKAQEIKRNYLNLFLGALYKRVPIIEFVKNYNFRENLVADLVAGLAVTGLHFPQGLAYAILAGLPPGIGMVSTIFPVLIYMLFGSAPHTSIGTNAIVSIMIGDMLLEPAMKASMAAAGGQNPVVELDMNGTLLSNTTAAAATYDVNEDLHSGYMEQRIALVAGSTFYCGIIFLLMAFFRMGFLVTYLSQSFMSGFTTGVAVHIFSSQIKTALGVKLPPAEGAGKLVKLYYNVFAHITSVHIADVIVSVVCIIILLIVKICINERLKLRVAIPIDFILLVVVTIISYFAKLPSNFAVKSIGTVELGIPTPILPAFSPIGPLLVYSLQIALVTFFLNISVIKIIARRNGYEINENIELNSYGMCNIIPAFFSNIPASIAPPRASLLSSMGAKTTLNATSTFAIMLLLIFYFGQFFESCPKAVLASMIMVAMKDLLKQVTILPKLWKVNKNDFTTWLIAATATVFIDIPYGLALGVLVSLLSVINQSQRGWVATIGKSDSEDLYLDAEDYGAIHEIPRVKIVRMESSLYFATAEKFRKSMYKIIEKDSDKYGEESDEEADHHEMNGIKTEMSGATLDSMVKQHPDTITEDDEENEESALNQEKKQADEKEKGDQFRIKVLIIDCMPINFIDGTGLDMLKLVIFELSCIDIQVYLARCSRYMLHLMEKSDVYDGFSRDHVFIDLPDAVDFALRHLDGDKEPLDHHVVNMKDEQSLSIPSRHSHNRLHSIHSLHSDYENFIHRNSIFKPYS